MKRRSVTISFRADPDLARLIDEARTRFGISRGDWVRGVVVSRLHEDDQSEINQRLIEVHEALSELLVEARTAEGTQRRALFAIITLAAGLSPEEARSAVREVFRRNIQQD